MAAEKRVEDLLMLLVQGYDQRSWHGPNLKNSIRGVGLKTAAWRPSPARHNIWEIVVHSAYWKYVVRRRLTGEKRNSFPLKGSNWFPRPERMRMSDWKADLELLEEQHTQLERAVSLLTEEDLSRDAGNRFDILQMVQGVAFHDIYHAGQIRLLRRLQE